MMGDVSYSDNSQDINSAKHSFSVFIPNAILSWFCYSPFFESAQNNTNTKLVVPAASSYAASVVCFYY